MAPTDPDLSAPDLRASCAHRLSGHRVETVAARLHRLADHPAAELVDDFYADGGAVALLEARVAELLAKPAARYGYKGVITQHALLRTRMEERGSRAVVHHPLGHIALDEDDGATHLHGLKSVLLGGDAPFTPHDVMNLADDPAVVVVELPLRRAGYQLTPWNDLVAISEHCRAHSIPFHIDGARLWEAAAGYGRSLAEITALADTVYVSFYKGLGGYAGCAIVGDAEVLDRVDVWSTRQGGRVLANAP